MRVIGSLEQAVTRVFSLAMAALVGIALAPTLAAAATDAAKPALTVVIEGGAILAQRSVGVHVWVENPMDEPITSVRLALAAPDDLFLQWWSSDIKDWCPHLLREGDPCPAQDGGVELAKNLSPHDALQSPHALRITAKDSVEEEDVNVAFVLTYATNGPAGARTGIVVAEKSLSVGLIGTETVAGVSLRLTFLFIPGAVMLMLLKAFKIPVVDSLDATNGAIITIMLSSGLSLLVSWLAARGWAPGLKPEVGVSLVLLGEVTGLAALIAVLAICGRGWQMKRRKAAVAAATVGDNDPLEVMLEKALKSAQGNFDPVIVTRRDATYVGAAAARTSSGGVVVMGWYELNTKDAELRTKLQSLLDAKDYVGALRMALEGGGALAPSDLVQERQADGSFRAISTINPLRIPAKDRPEVTRTAGQGVQESPLVLSDL